jgi:hypothetical protein
MKTRTPASKKIKTTCQLFAVVLRYRRERNVSDVTDATTAAEIADEINRNKKLYGYGAEIVPVKLNFAA